MSGRRKLMHIRKLKTGMLMNMEMDIQSKMSRISG